MRINLTGTWLNLEALDPVSVSSLGPSTSTAVRLAREWLSGQQEFTFHTSGSTGAPRPVHFQRSQLQASAQLSINGIGLRAGMSCLACLDTRFVAGAMMVIRAAVAEMDLVIREPSANPLMGIEEEIDFLAVVPLQLTTILQESPLGLGQATKVIIGGAPLGEDVIAQLDSFQTDFYSTYGMTETLTHIALRKLNGPEKQESFHLLPGVSASNDERGCLVIQAAHLGPETIYTNDLAEWTSDGGFRITGRFDDLINSGGIKIPPAPIMMAVGQSFAQLGLQCRYFIAGVPDDRLTEKVGLVIEGSPLPSSVEAELNELLKARLNRFEVPRAILYVSHFLETPTQKIDQRNTLAELLRKTP